MTDPAHEAHADGTPLPEEGGPAPQDEPQDQAAPQAPADGEVPEDQMDTDLAKAQADVDALTLDLQRLQAEYLNYKRRVDRDRQLIEENAAYKALTPVVEVLDAIDRAREAGDLDGGFKAVAEQLERAVKQAGLQAFGEVGDPFDPNLHEALTNLGPDPDVSVTSVKVVAKRGYRMGERVVRAAQVLVVEPDPGSAGSAGSEEDPEQPQE